MRTRLGKPEFTYEIACAQLCGLGHYKMRGFLTIDTQEGFQKWMDDEEAKLKEEGDNSGWN
jgi:cytochrome c oxidase subunit 2